MLYFRLVLVAVFWSGVFPAVNIALRSMGVYSQVFLRFATAVAILLAIRVWPERRLRRLTPREAALVVGLGLLGISLYNSLFTAGLALVEASRAALIVPTNPAFTALFAVLLLRERIGAARACGVALSVLGALWVLSRGELRALAALELGRGEWILILCIFLWSAYTLLGRIAMSSLPPLAFTAYVMAAGAIPLALPAWMEHGSPGAATRAGGGALRYLVGFGALLPFPWVNEGGKALGAARASQFINLVPPLAVAESILLLGERFDPSLLVGAVLVILGLALTNRPR